MNPQVILLIAFVALAIYLPVACWLCERGAHRDVQAIVREQLAAYLTEQAGTRFDVYGPYDARGAAFWDVAVGLREGDIVLVDTWTGR